MIHVNVLCGLGCVTRNTAGTHQNGNEWISIGCGTFPTDRPSVRSKESTPGVAVLRNHNTPGPAGSGFGPVATASNSAEVYRPPTARVVLSPGCRIRLDMTESHGAAVV